MKKIAISLLAVAAMSQMALATSITAKYKGVNSAGRKAVHIYHPNAEGFGSVHSHVYAGESTFQLLSVSPDGSAMDFALDHLENPIRHAYCVDVFEQIHANTTHTWDIVPLPEAPLAAAMGQHRALQLMWLYTNALPDPTANYSAAWQLQLAIWEVATETGDVLDLSDGGFYTTASAGTAQTWLDTLNTLSQEDLEEMTLNYSVGLVNNGAQDFVVSFDIPNPPPPPSVPEPMTMMTAGLALAGIGRYVRKRRSA